MSNDMNNDTALAVAEPVVNTGSLSTFGTIDPSATIAIANKWANELVNIIKQKPGLVANISGKKFPVVECWTTLGAMVGVFPQVEGEVRTSGSWKEGDFTAIATVTARTLDGKVVGRAEALCSQEEKMRGNPRWQDKYAVFSMAQTRAIAKALRLPLSWVLQMAGIETTPAEEIPPGGFSNGNTAPAAEDHLPEATELLGKSDMIRILGLPDDLIAEPEKRLFVVTAAMVLTDGDLSSAQQLIRDWGTFEKDGKTFVGPLPYEKRANGSLKMAGKWLNAILSRAKEAYANAEVPE